MVLSLHIRSAETNEVVPVKMSKMSKADAMQTNKEPLWQSSWTSEFISDKEKLKYRKLQVQVGHVHGRTS